MSYPEITIDFPAEDVRAMMRAMQRQAAELGAGLKLQIKTAAGMVARSMATMTYEPHRDVVKSTKRRKSELVKATVERKFTNQEYLVKRWYQGKLRTFSIYAPSKTAANKMSQVKIGNWGLAKASWMFGLKKLGPGAKFGFATQSARRGAYQATTVEMNLNPVDPWVRITNRLPYILDVVPGGESALNGAMGKAARAMEHSIDEQLKRKMKAS